MSRWSPKDWTRPRSRAHREAHDGTAPVTTTDILKRLYHCGEVRPQWAETARKFGWLTYGEYYAIEPTEIVSSGIAELCYRESLFVGLFAKVTNFAGPEAAQVP